MPFGGADGVVRTRGALHSGPDLKKIVAKIRHSNYFTHLCHFSSKFGQESSSVIEFLDLKS